MYGGMLFGLTRTDWAHERQKRSEEDEMRRTFRVLVASTVLSLALAAPRPAQAETAGYCQAFCWATYSVCAISGPLSGIYCLSWLQGCLYGCQA